MQSDHYLWRYCILKIWGIQSVIWLRTQLFQSSESIKFQQQHTSGGIHPHIKLERDPLNIFLVRELTSSGSTGGGGRGDAKTIISPNTSFGDIIKPNKYLLIQSRIFFIKFQQQQRGASEQREGLPWLQNVEIGRVKYMHLVEIRGSEIVECRNLVGKILLKMEIKGHKIVE